MCFMRVLADMESATRPHHRIRQSNFSTTGQSMSCTATSKALQLDEVSCIIVLYRTCLQKPCFQIYEQHA